MSTSSLTASGPPVPEKSTAGRLGYLTQPQEQALTQLRTELILADEFVPSRHDDYLLLRFLRARRFDVPKARAMLTSCEQWRKEFKVDDILSTFTFPEAAAVAKIYPQFYHKVDRLGRPVYVEQLGKLNMKELHSITTFERMQQKLVAEYELSSLWRYPACSKIAGRNIEQSCTILDLQGVSLMSFSQVASFIKEVSKIGQDYYPESLGTMFIINAPMLFSSVWALIKPFLDEVTVKKIFILGSSYKSKLMEYIDPENCPDIFGGQSRVPDGKFEMSDEGPWKQISKDELAKERDEQTKKLTELMLKVKAEHAASNPTANTKANPNSSITHQSNSTTPSKVA